MAASGDRPLVWDLPVRLFHWALATAVVVSIVSVEILDDIGLHVRSGQVVLALLVFRLVWWIAGPPGADLRSLFVSMSRLPAYLRGGEVRYHGHSPLGAWSVAAMMLSLIVQVLTGLGADDEIFTTGPLVPYLSESQIALANRVHEANKFVLFGLVGLHLAAIAFYAFARRRNLVGPMITGRGQPGEQGQLPTGSRPAWLAVLAAALAAGTAWLVFRLG